MPAFFHYAFSCPRCKAIMSGKRLKDNAIYFTELYSDGKMICDGFIASDQQLVLCPSCAHTFWMDEKIQLSDLDDFTNKSQIYPFQSWYLFGTDPRETEGILALVEHCKRMLTTMKPYTTEQEMYLRKLLLWAYNDLIRFHATKSHFHLLHPMVYFRSIKKKAKQAQLFRKLQPAYSSNIKLLISLLRVHDNKPESRAFIAELFREKGNFIKSIEILTAMNRSTYFVNEIMHKAQHKDTFVFKVAG